MRPLTSQFSASVARRDHVVKKTCVGAMPRTAAATASASSRSATSGVMRSSRPSGRRHRPVTSQPSARSRRGKVPAADARHADDERAPARTSVAGHGLPVGGRSSVLPCARLVFTSAKRGLADGFGRLLHRLGAAPTAHDPDCTHGLGALVAETMRRRRREGDRVARLEDELVEADDDSERAR